MEIAAEHPKEVVGGVGTIIDVSLAVSGSRFKDLG
jgi:hypothetical protein